mgnify:CR=1 FL=1
MNWYYEEAPPNGGAGGDAFKSSFNGAGKKPAAILARESVQNSVDAGVDPASEIRVDFRFRQLSGDDRTRFFESAMLGDMAGFVDLLDCAEPNCITAPDSNLELLYIDDYETTGLKGDPTDPSSNLRKLLMELGGSPKVGRGSRDYGSDGPAAGGSYGFGKAVYSSNSRLGTIFAFSRTHDDAGNEISVLMGCAYQAAHERDSRHFTGRAWLGKPKELEGRGVRLDPFINEEAERLAKELGFRRDQGCGTSILVLDTSIHGSDLISGLEDYWWPRIQRRLLDATVVTSDMVEHVPAPRKKDHLRPFIEAFEIALGNSPVQAGKSDRYELRRKTITDKNGQEQIFALGVLGSTLISEDSEEIFFDEEHEEMIDSVALIRGPFMVVDYHSRWHIRGAVPPAAGCFIAHHDVDGILRLAEPLEHDQWDSNSQRIAKKDPALAELVSTILQRIKFKFTNFQKDAKPREAKEHRALRQLERNLASWFGPSKPIPPVPPKNPAPISLRPSIEVTAVDGGLRASGEVVLGLSRQAVQAGSEEVDVKLSLTLKVEEEDSVPSGDPIPLSVDPVDESFEKLVERAEKGPDKVFWVGTVKKGKSSRLRFDSSVYDSSWTVQLLPHAEEWKRQIEQ